MKKDKLCLALTPHQYQATAATAPRNFEGCLREAETRCLQARRAASSHRYNAARQLYIEATQLYRQAESIDGIAYPLLESRLAAIDAEMQAFPGYIRDSG